MVVWSRAGHLYISRATTSFRFPAHSGHGTLDRQVPFAAAFSGNFRFRNPRLDIQGGPRHCSQKSNHGANADL